MGAQIRMESQLHMTGDSLYMKVMENLVILEQKSRGFPGGVVVGNPPANSGDTGSSPGPGRSHTLRSN